MTIWPDISAALTRIADLENVRILLAVESGSRAWGFPSLDSDWDVRFVYVRRDRDRYATLWPGRDVLEATQGDLDFAGWDIVKALRLAEKSNPGILEWLQSPIIYGADPSFVGPLRAIMERFQPRALMYHYASLAHRCHAAYLKQPGPARLKKYLYAIRPIMCVEWMVEHGDRVPPILFDRLRKSVRVDRDVEAEIADLLERKSRGMEGEEGRYPALDRYIVEGIEWARDEAAKADADRQPNRAALDELYRRVIG